MVTPPTKGDFNKACPIPVKWKLKGWPIKVPVPYSAHILYATSAEDKWPVVDSSYGYVHAEGSLNEILFASEDSPVIHTSHDLDMKVQLAKGYEWLSIQPPDGDPSNEVLETESAGFPHIARPEVNDHITVEGRWIFDCGHDGYTEIHPTPVFESDRVTYRPLYPKAKLQAMQLVRVWMNSYPAPFDYDLIPFQFDVKLPGGGSAFAVEMPFLRVVSGFNMETLPPTSITTKAITATRLSDKSDMVHVIVTPPSTRGKYFFELMLGYLRGPYTSKGDLYTPKDVRAYTIRLEAIKIIKEESGIWFYDVHINGEWRPVFHNSLVKRNDKISLIYVSPIAVVGTELSIGVTAYYRTEGDLSKGELDQGMYGGAWKLESLVDRGEMSCKSPDNWILYFTVSRGEPDSIVTDLSYWKPRLDEVSDLGIISVPSKDQPPSVTNIDAYLTEYPLYHDYDQISLLGPDIDQYRFKLEDVAEVIFGPLPDMVKWHEFPHYKPLIPDKLKKMFGPISYDITIQSMSGRSGDVPYTLSIQKSYKVIPPDWGVAFDKIKTLRRGKKIILSGGRSVDLYTPSHDAEITVDDKGPGLVELGGGSRQLTVKWAWQHLAEEVQVYDIWFPKEGIPSTGHKKCHHDRKANLEISARGGSVHLHVIESGEEGNDQLTLENLDTLYPLGHVHLKVTRPKPRCAYQLDVTWNNAVYYTPRGCRYMDDLFHPALHIPVPWPPVIRSWRDLEPIATDGPDMREMEFVSGGGFLRVNGISNGNLNVIVSSSTHHSIFARLYNSDNVLISESLPIENEVFNQQLITGVISQTRLIANDLDKNETYFLHVIPEFNVNGPELQNGRIDFFPAKEGVLG
jgi:hypothetical protein